MPRTYWQKFKDRKLVQWAAAYAVVTWLVIQGASLIAETFEWPATVLKVLTYLLASGIFPVLVLAWYHGDKGEQQVSGTEVLMLAGYAVLILIAGSRYLDQPDSAVNLRALHSFEMKVISIDPPADTILTADHFVPALDVSVALEYTFDPPLSDLPLVKDLTLDLGVVLDESANSFRMMQIDSKSVSAFPLQATLRARIDRAQIRSGTLKLHIAANLHERNNSRWTIGDPVRIEYQLRNSAD